MPLLDHFHPPLSRQRRWDSFHGAWAEAIARLLNEGLLPEHYYAESRFKVGSQVEIDVGTYAENETLNGHADEGGVALWAPPKPVATATLDFADLDVIEVQILNDEEGPHVVAAIELVSPSNKDRPSHRRAFVVKCAAYIQESINVMVVDVVTERQGNMHADLLELLRVPPVAPSDAADLYATAYRSVAAQDKRQLEIWAETLSIGTALPTLPLWIAPDLSIAIDLELAYQAGCVARRIG